MKATDWIKSEHPAIYASLDADELKSLVFMMEGFASQSDEQISEFEKVIVDLHKWQLETFPEADQLSKIYHLKKEVGELLESIETGRITPSAVEKVEMEYADCFMLLFGSAMSADYTLSDITTMIKDKMVINRGRKWGKPDENGVVQHLPPQEKKEESRV